jgi:hypothetical protein
MQCIHIVFTRFPFPGQWEKQKNLLGFALIRGLADKNQRLPQNRVCLRNEPATYGVPGRKRLIIQRVLPVADFGISATS